MQNKPVCYVPDREIPEIYSGTPTFLGLPKIETQDSLKDYDFVFMGVPWEGICTWGDSSGCEFATKLVRAASVRYAGYLPDYDVDIFDYATGGDYGDTATINGDYDFSFGEMRKKIGEVVEADKFPVIFGGDHSVSYPLISEFAAKYAAKGKKIGVIHFDAHFDNMESFGDEKLARCSPFYRMYEDPNIDPKNMVHVGIRGPRNNPMGMKAAKEFGATVITGLEIKKQGYEKAIQKAIEIASEGTDALYVTVCSDILDVANNPGAAPDPCGVTSFELAMMLHECGKANTEAFDYVEILPFNDPNNVSAHTAVWLTVYMLSGVVQRKHGLL